MEMAATRSVPQVKHTANPDDLFVSFELGDKQWRLSISDGRHGVSRYRVAAGSKSAVLDCIVSAGVRFGTPPNATVHSCYEAGRDGWWLHRWLCELGVDNTVVDASSIEVNRRARRAKTDRLDADKLLAMLMRHHAGERVWSVLREPQPRRRGRATCEPRTAAPRARAHRAHQPRRLAARAAQPAIRPGRQQPCLDELVA
jgi:transposase